MKPRPKREPATGAEVLDLVEAGHAIEVATEEVRAVAGEMEAWMAEIAALNDLVEGLLTTQDAVLVVLTGAGRVRGWSRGAVAAYGIDAGDVLGRHVGSLHLSHFPGARLARAAAAVVQGGGPMEVSNDVDDIVFRVEPLSGNRDGAVPLAALATGRVRPGRTSAPAGGP